MGRNSEILVSSLQESLIFTVGCAAVAVAVEVLLAIPFLDALGLVLLVVSAGMMLVGGALSFVTPAKVRVFNLLVKSKDDPTEEDYRKNENKAAVYALTGALLFAYSLVLGFALR